MAGRGPDERWGRLARLDRGEVKARPSGFPEERPERRNATSGAPGGARAGHTARGTSAKVPSLRSAERRSAPSLEGGRKNEGGAPRLRTSGAAGACLHACSAPQNMTTAPREAAKLPATTPTAPIKPEFAMSTAVSAKSSPKPAQVLKDADFNWEDPLG